MFVSRNLEQPFFLILNTRIPRLRCLKTNYCSSCSTPSMTQSFSAYLTAPFSPQRFFSVVCSPLGSGKRQQHPKQAPTYCGHLLSVYVVKLLKWPSYVPQWNTFDHDLYSRAALATQLARETYGPSIVYVYQLAVAVAADFNCCMCCLLQNLQSL